MPTGFTNGKMITINDVSFSVKDVDYFGEQMIVQELSSRVTKAEFTEDTVVTDIGEYLITEKYETDLDTLIAMHESFVPQKISTVKGAVRYFDMDLIITNSYLVAYKNNNLPEGIIAPASEFEYDPESYCYRIVRDGVYSYYPLEQSNLTENELSLLTSDLNIEEECEKLPSDIVKQLSKIKSTIKRFKLPGGREGLITKGSRIVSNDLDEFVGIPGAYLCKIVGVISSGKYKLNNGAILKVEKAIYED